MRYLFLLRVFLSSSKVAASIFNYIVVVLILMVIGEDEMRMNSWTSEIICESRVIRDLLDRETLLLID